MKEMLRSQLEEMDVQFKENEDERSEDFDEDPYMKFLTMLHTVILEGRVHGGGR